MVLKVTRVALEVGTQGILGGQARVEGVQGTWADLTRNVNVRSPSLLSPSIHPLFSLSILSIPNPTRPPTIHSRGGVWC